MTAWKKVSWLLAAAAVATIGGYASMGKVAAAEDAAGYSPMGDASAAEEIAAIQSILLDPAKYGNGQKASEWEATVPYAERPAKWMEFTEADRDIDPVYASMVRKIEKGLRGVKNGKINISFRCNYFHDRGNRYDARDSRSDDETKLSASNAAMEIINNYSGFINEPINIYPKGFLFQTTWPVHNASMERFLESRKSFDVHSMIEDAYDVMNAMNVRWVVRHASTFNRPMTVYEIIKYSNPIRHSIDSGPFGGGYSQTTAIRPDLLLPPGKSYHFVMVNEYTHDDFQLSILQFTDGINRYAVVELLAKYETGFFGGSALTGWSSDGMCKGE